MAVSLTESYLKDLFNRANGIVNYVGQSSLSDRTVSLLNTFNSLYEQKINGINFSSVLIDEQIFDETKNKKEELMELIQRIRTTAALLGVRLTPEHDAELAKFTSINEANKFLIGLKTSAKASLLTQDQINIIKSGTGSYLDPELRRLEQIMKEKMSNVESYQASINSCYRDYFSAKAKFENMKKDESTTVSGVINDVLTEGYYLLKYVCQTYIEFFTPNVICNYIDIEKNINMSVNLGVFAVRIHFNNLDVEVMAFQHNIKSNGYYHPHISNSRLCWGNVANAYALARKNYDIKTILDCVKNLLSNYNPDSPYERLDRFDAIVNKEKYQDVYKYLTAEQLKIISPSYIAYKYWQVIDHDSNPIGLDLEGFVVANKEELQDEEGQQQCFYYYEIFYRRNSLSGQIDESPYIKDSSGDYLSIDEFESENPDYEYELTNGW